jgi:hypothetical protein
MVEAEVVAFQSPERAAQLRVAVALDRGCPRRLLSKKAHVEDQLQDLATARSKLGEH